MKKLIAMLLTAGMCISLVGCSLRDKKETPSTTQTVTVSESEKTTEVITEEITESSQEEETSVSITQSSTEMYQAVLDEYSQKIKDAVPGLIEEYNTEAANNTDGLTGLAKLCNDKVGELAKISNEGIGKMAEIMLYHGSGKQDEYTEWAEKLMNVYTEEAGKIQDVYMDSAT